MAKRNKDDLRIDETAEGVVIRVKNYDPNLLLQHIVFLIVLLVLNVCALSFSWENLTTLSGMLLLAYTGYRMVYNLNDHFLVTIKNGSLEIIKGMHNVRIVNLPLNEIQKVYIKRRTGKVLVSARSNHTSVTPNINELRITTSIKEYFVSSEMEYSVQVAIRNKIQEQIALQKQ